MVQLPSTTAELITFTLTLMTLSHMKPLQLRYKSALLKPNGLEFANFTLSPKSVKLKTAQNATDISQPNVLSVSIQEEFLQIRSLMEPASVMVFTTKNHIPANALTHALLFRFNIMVTRQQGTVKHHVRQGILLWMTLTDARLIVLRPQASQGTYCSEIQETENVSLYVLTQSLMHTHLPLTEPAMRLVLEALTPRMQLTDVVLLSVPTIQLTNFLATTENASQHALWGSGQTQEPSSAFLTVIQPQHIHSKIIQPVSDIVLACAQPQTSSVTQPTTLALKHVRTQLLVNDTTLLGL
jgi:hypothetical protein